MTKDDVSKNYSPLALAYLGDSVYELYVRAYLLESGNCPNHVLNDRARSFVKCEAQQHFLEVLAPHLLPDEAALVRRGRNAKSATKPHHATHGAYHAATALEALFGYLYLAGETARLTALFEIICKKEEAE